MAIMAFKVIEVGTNRNIQISDTLHFQATLWGLRDNVRCSSWAHWKARSGLPINVNWTFFCWVLWLSC